MLSKTELALIDIQDAILAAQAFLKDMRFEAFTTSRLHFFAATRALEIVSEASRRLSSEFRDQHSTLPWKKIMGAGNVYRHSYAMWKNRWFGPLSRTTCHRSWPWSKVLCKIWRSVSLT